MILVIFPNQLFANHPGLGRELSKAILVEDSLYFGDSRYPMRFHKQKLWLHRASMKRYEASLKEQGIPTQYLDYDPKHSMLVDQLKASIPLKERRANQLVTLEPSDFMLHKRLQKAADTLGMKLNLLPNPMFLNSPQENAGYRRDKKRWFMADFYKWQRQRLNILVDDDQPAGGQWSFDEENRKKIPKERLSNLPMIPSVDRDEIDLEAKAYVEERFPDNLGSLETLIYPTSHASAQIWLKDFLEHRFEHFGDYEDAIEPGESWLWHAILTPSLNIGLLTPLEVMETTLSFAKRHEVPINSVEGFVRQIIGWREFMRATYEDLGVAMRTTNHWNHGRRLPKSFYEGTTGIVPVDDTIHRILKTGYCHHIERLMVLGGFLFLCEVDPDDIYRWFMEMFIDSYDWVMVPNVYAMSQNADGGNITTKPYFSGSSYVCKMSHYKKGPWCDVWDGLYWRWIWNHSEELAKNPRWAMMCSMVKKMDAAKRKQHLDRAEAFLESMQVD